MAPTHMPEQLGRYRIKKRLGGGGMGAVYLVENTELQREEALKVPHFGSEDNAAVRERFLREAQAAAKMNHANLCPVYEAGVIDGIWFLTMRHLPGRPLSAYTGRPHPPYAALKIVAKLAEALEHAHTKGVIHRDLKPGNIMMCPGTGPTVMDFGLAKHIRQQDRKLTQTGATLGTPAYMPPEQVKGELDRIGPASDIYSLGVILFELLTGRLPFDGAAGEVMAKVVFIEAPSPSDVLPGLSPALDAVCRKAMAKEPKDRYPSMKAFAGELAELMSSLPATADIGVSVVTNQDRREFVDKATLPPGQNTAKTRTPGHEPGKPRRGDKPVTMAADGAEARRSIRQHPSGKAPSRRGKRLERGPWLAGLLGLAMVVAVISVVGALLHLGNRKWGSSDLPDGIGGTGEGTSMKDGREIPDRFTNGVDMKLVRIPGTRETNGVKGTFMMGSPRSEWILWGAPYTKGEDQHDVEVSPFHMGVFEVTQKQFRAVLDYNPSYFSRNPSVKQGSDDAKANAGVGKGSIPSRDDPDDYPVENVSWDEAKEFCEKLTVLDEKRPPGWVYRLPTEAEWEYACRGGATSYQVFHYGNTLCSTQANFQGFIPYPPVNDPRPGGVPGPTLRRTCKVGSYIPNGFGLYDMHGNVFEWCQDWWEEDYYQRSPRKDPTGPAIGTVKVFRGGSWNLNGFDCRSAWRPPGHKLTYRFNGLGFRVALVPPGR